MLRTLSARILISFAVLAITFVVTTASLIGNTSEVESEVDLIGNGYVKAAMAASDLQLREEALNTYLTQQIPDEKTVAAAQTHLRQKNEDRVDALKTTIDAMADVQLLALTRDAHEYNYIISQLDIVHTSVEDIQADIAKLIDKPPLGDDAHAPAFQRKRDRVWVRRAKSLMPGLPQK